EDKTDTRCPRYCSACRRRSSPPTRRRGRTTAPTRRRRRTVRTWLSTVHRPQASVRGSVLGAAPQCPEGSALRGMPDHREHGRTGRRVASHPPSHAGAHQTRTFPERVSWLASGSAARLATRALYHARSRGTRGAANGSAPRSLEESRGLRLVDRRS